VSRPPLLRHTIFANSVGQAWTALFTLASVPVYIHKLGIEAYGVVAFLASLQAILGLLDLGLATSINREVSLRSPHKSRHAEMRDLVRTFEVLYIVVGAVIALSVVLAAQWLTTAWVKPGALGPSTLQLATVVFGITIGIQWPVSMYKGVMFGLERQIRLNAITMAVTTFRRGGALIVVLLVSPTLMAFLLWQLIAAVFEVVVLGVRAWAELPKGETPAVAPHLIRATWRFTASVGGNSLLAALLKQSDRLILTRLLPLRYLGYYSAASTAAGSVALLYQPVISSALPRFSTLFGAGHTDELARAYHKLSQLVAIASAPAGAVLIFFSHDVLRWWTQSSDVSTNAAGTLTLLAFANLLNAMMQVPFALQLAAGITWIAIVNNLVSVLLLLPLMYTLISHLGLGGAGVAWVVFNMAYFLIVPHVMHRHVLIGHARRWFLLDTLPFLITAILLAGGVRMVRDIGADLPVVVMAAILGVAVYGWLALKLSPELRELLRRVIARTRDLPLPTTL
jgi:O-antigen/teichoic acid export membrane protein